MKKEIDPAMTQRLEVLASSIAETSRLLVKLKEAKSKLETEIQEYKSSQQEYLYFNNNCRYFSAAKRAALDVKKELTKLTQFTVKY